MSAAKIRLSLLSILLRPPTTDDDRDGLVSESMSGKYSQLVLLGPTLPRAFVLSLAHGP